MSIYFRDIINQVKEEITLPSFSYTRDRDICGQTLSAEPAEEREGDSLVEPGPLIGRAAENRCRG